MACGTGFCAGKLIAVLVAVGAGGYASYNYATDGCPLGSSCGVTTKSVENHAAFEQLVAQQEDDALPACCAAADQTDQAVEVAATDAPHCGASGDCPFADGAAMTEVAATDAPACAADGTCPMTGEPIAAKDCPMNGDPANCPHAGSCDGGQCPTASKDEVAANETDDNTDG